MDIRELKRCTSIVSVLFAFLGSVFAHNFGGNRLFDDFVGKRIEYDNPLRSTLMKYHYITFALNR